MSQSNTVNLNLDGTPLSISPNENVIEVLSKKYRFVSAIDFLNLLMRIWSANAKWTSLEQEFALLIRKLDYAKLRLVTLACSQMILYDLYLRRNRLEKKLITLSVILFLSCVALLATFVILGILYDKDVCMDENCIVSAARLLNSMNTSSDPCTDFYEYACGNWGDHHIHSPGDSNTWFTEGTKRLSDKILRILIGSSEDNDIKPVLQARELYHMCLDTDALHSQGLEPLYKVLDMLQLPRTTPNKRTVSSFKIAKTLALAQRVMSADILITLSTTIDESTNKTIFQVSPAQGDSPFPDVWSNKKKQNRGVSIRQLFIQQLSYVASIIAEVDPGETNATVIATAALRIIIIDSQLRTDFENSANDDKKMTFSELQDLMNYTKVYDEDGNREFKWNDYIDTLMDGINNTLNMDDVVVVNNPNFFYQLGKRLAVFKVEALERLVWWKVVEILAPHTTDEMRNYRNAYSEAIFHSARPSRPSTCVSVVKSFLNLAVGYKLSLQNNQTRTFMKVNEIMLDIRNAFQTLIDSSNWIDNDTKQSITNKVNSVQAVIGYPKELSNPEWITKFYETVELSAAGYIPSLLNIKARHVEMILLSINTIESSERLETSLSVDPLDVNAYYSRTSNSIAIPAGILQPPFYSDEIQVLNYAGIGAILGHELTHGFDNEGKDYDSRGIHKPWWDEDMINKFNNKTLCYISQYDNYKVNGTVTLSENIADNGGVKEAFYAFQKYLLTRKAELILPGFEDYSPQQVFFIAFANVWCKKDNINVRNNILHDDHSPNKYRVIGSLANLPEFAETWKCKRKSVMNPTKRCELW